MATLRRMRQNRTYRENYERIDWGKKKIFIPEEELTDEQREQREQDRRKKRRVSLEWLGIQ